MDRLIPIVLCLTCGCARPAPCECAPAASAPSRTTVEKESTASSWPFEVETKDELLRLGVYSPEWKQLTFEGMDLAIAIETMPTDGESYIDVRGYVFNRRFKSWRRFFDVQVRGAGGVNVSVDGSDLVVTGTANNALRGEALFTFDLRAVHDDR